MNLKLGENIAINFCVSDEIYHGFRTLFKDNSPLHTDEQFAISKGFEGKVMHGNILNGFLSFFIGECLPGKNVTIHSQGIQFQKPIYLNDKLQFNAEVSEIHESVRTIGFKFIFRNETGNTVAKGTIQIGLLK